MSFSRWLLLIVVLVGLGCLKAAQHNAMFLKGYAVGKRVSRLHTQENDVAWLQAHVMELTSPTHLSQVAQDRQLKLVAWSLLSSTVPSALPTSKTSALALHPTSLQAARPAQSLVHIASKSSEPSSGEDDTAD